MPHPHITVTRQDGIRTLLIDAPDRLNAVTEPMLLALGDAALEEPGDDRVIVVRGAGRGFCAGADLDIAGELATSAAAGTVDALNRLVGALTASPLPVVAVVQGPCAGAGVSIALAADVVIAASTAFFQLAFARIGLMPDGGATALVAASVGRSRALRMALLAERLGAQEAASIGLIAQAVAPDELADAADRVIRELATGPAAAYAHTKAAVNAAALPTLADAFAIERAGQLGLLAAADFAEGAAAFTAKRAPRFTDPAV